MYVVCCNVKQKADVYKVVPFLDNTTDEYILYRPHCKKCNRPIMMNIGLDENETKIHELRVSQKNIPKMLDKLKGITLFKPKTLRVPQGKNGWYLMCSVFGVKHKCYSNLSSMPQTLKSWDEDSLNKKDLRDD